MPPIVHEVLRSPGQPLDRPVQVLLEARLGQDFSGVRIHTGRQADASARSVNALAYTVGRHVVFAAEQYRPASVAGQRLLAHEFTHVVQQRETPSALAGNLVVGPPDSTLEREAVQAEASMADGPSQTQAKTGAGTLQRQPAAPQDSFEGCDPAIQSDLQAKHQPALEHLNRAIASLTPGWARMDPAHKVPFRQFFDPAGSGDIDEGFVRDVRANFQRIRSYMGSLRFDCDPDSWTLCGTSSRWCTGGRLMWTCFGNLHVCTNAYPTASEPFKIETMIHESVHNTLLTTDRAYANRPEFSQLRPRGGGFWGSVLNVLGQLPVLGLLFRSLPGNNDTINNPDSYAEYAMQV